MIIDFEVGHSYLGRTKINVVFNLKKTKHHLFYI